MDYTSLIGDITNYTTQGTPAPEFTAALPSFITNAEQRIYRKLIPSAASGQNMSLSTTAGQRRLDFGAMVGQSIHGMPVAFPYPMIVEAVAVLVSDALNGQPGWIQFMPTSIEFIDSIWPSPTVVGTPGFPLAYYNMLDDQTMVMAPTPAAVYPVRVTGVWRPAGMSVVITETWLSRTFPDLLFKGCMVEATGWMRDYGAQSDDPKLAISWVGQYEDALRTAMQEEAMRQGQGSVYRAMAAQVPQLGGGPPPAGQGDAP
jgi:hypothetical protein